MASKNEITVQVCTASACSFIPFTPVPEAWRGMQVKIVPIIDESELPPFQLGDDAD